MKKIHASERIGRGLFTDELLELEFDFHGGEKLWLRVYPITQDMVVEFHKDGIKFADYANELEALEHSARVFNRIVESATYTDADGKAHDLEGKYKDRILQLPSVLTAIFEEARKHAAEIDQADEGNSDS